MKPVIDSELAYAGMERQKKRSEIAEARVAELERTIAWLRRAASTDWPAACDEAECMRRHLTSKPPEDWNIPERDNQAAVSSEEAK